LRAVSSFAAIRASFLKARLFGPTKDRSRDGPVAAGYLPLAGWTDKGRAPFRFRVSRYVESAMSSAEASTQRIPINFQRRSAMFPFSSIFARSFSRLAGLPSERRQPSRQRTNAVRPALEALDDRVLPSCTYQVGPALQIAGHRLTITGDNSINNLVIHDDGTAGVNNVRVSCNGGPWYMPGKAISEVVMFPGGGHDSVLYKMMGNVLPGVQRHVGDNFGNGGNTFTAMVKSVGANADVQFAAAPLWGQSTGSGNDLLQAIVQGNVASGADLEFAYDGGAGNNALLASASHVNVAPGAKLLFTLWGDDPDSTDLGGHNCVAVNYSGRMDGQLVLDDRCQGGTPGSFGGVVDDDITLNAGSHGTVMGVLTGPGYGAMVRGGVGIDRLRFVIHAPHTAKVANASIQGDGSLDEAVHTANVATGGTFSVNQVVP
jgi:hypothetical protein